MSTVLIGRFLGGAFGSTGSTLVGGTLSDIWETKDRGLPMALFSVGAIFGTGIGPVWSGWVAQDLSWRWIQWIQAAFTAGGFVLLVIFSPETRGSVILTRRAAKLRKETGDNRYRARAEAERASIAVLIKTSLTRPLWLLISEPIVFFFSLWISLLWGVMYCLLSAIGLVTELHNFTQGQNGLVFLAICTAAIIGFFTNFIQEDLYAKKVGQKGPEARLYLAMVSAILFPAGECKVGVGGENTADSSLFSFAATRLLHFWLDCVPRRLHCRAHCGHRGTYDGGLSRLLGRVQLPRRLVLDLCFIGTCSSVLCS